LSGLFKVVHDVRPVAATCKILVKNLRKQHMIVGDQNFHLLDPSFFQIFSIDSVAWQ
jgi:hypothetical protein